MKKVVIVGRPNVGKSTLFNRLAGRRAALTGSTPGLTRDRREELVFINDQEIMLSDTAGLEDLSALAQRMRQQTEVAVQAADLCLLVLDGGDGLLPDDHEAVRLLRKTGVPVLPIVNKADRREAENVGYAVINLGFGEPVFVSAEHGEGIATLCAMITERLPEEAAVPEGARPLRLAIVGRPNAGKSTLINTLLGEQRLLTGPEPGLTRDSVSVPFRFAGHSFLLHDTAGMRRKSRVIDINEQASVDDTLRALRFADAVVLLTDAPRSFEKQDLQIAELTADEGRAMVIGLNKWDTVGAVDLNDVRSYTDKMLPQMRGVPVVPCAGASGYGLEALLRAVLLQEQRRNRRIPTGPLNRFLREMTERHPLPAVGGRRLRIKYMTQIKTRPPTFALFVSNPEGMPEDYLRYLTNGLREAFDLPGVPLRFHMRRSAGDNPYADAERADHAPLMGKRPRGR